MGFRLLRAGYLEQLLNIYPKQHKELELEIKEEDIPENLKAVMFRIIEEALNNGAKLSRAEWVDVRLVLDNGNIKLEISDDGAGMDLNLILESSTEKSMGLPGMKERAEFSGGALTIDSAPNEDTTAKVVWPINCNGHLSEGEQKP